MSDQGLHCLLSCLTFCDSKILVNDLDRGVENSIVDSGSKLFAKVNSILQKLPPCWEIVFVLKEENKKQCKN